MTVSYRDKLKNYMNDSKGQYASIGSIFSVLVDANSDGGSESPEYSYPGYIYCDGRELNIRDYPQLYVAVRNTYGGSTQVTRTQSSNPGGIRRLYWINNKAFFNIYRDPGVNSSIQLPYPYGTNFRFTSDGSALGSLPSTVFEVNIFYSTKAPTEDVSAYVPVGGTEFAYEIVFPTDVNPATLPQTNIDIVSGTHPNVIFSRSFNLRDYPYNIGTFFLPDYRDRIVTGVGPVNGSGSSTIENALINNVGQTGGIWFISKDKLLEGETFFTVGDVRTRGYSNISADIFTYMTGSVEYTIGPVDDHIFSKPVEHFHYVLSSEPDQSFESEFSGIAVDKYAALYSKSRANIIPFEPEGDGGLALGHSHGLTATPLNDPKIATYGNTPGIGGQDPEIAPRDEYDVNDPFLVATAQYSGTALIPYGTGEGEVGGFAAPNVTNRGSNYVAFGTPGTSPFSSLQSSRSVSYEVDLSEYEKLFTFAIMGNDSNGGERVNNEGEGLYVRWPDGSEVQLLPSGRDFNASAGSTGGFQAYDAAYSTWRQSEVDIPSQYRTSGVRFTIRQTVISTTGVNQDSEEMMDESNPAGNPNGYDAVGLQSIGFQKPIPDTLPQDEGIYPITGSPSVTITQITYDSADNICIATTQETHSFESGDFVDIVGANPSEYNGTFEVLDTNLTGITFAYTPTDPPASSPSTGLPIVKLSSGKFEEVVTVPAPRVYVINDQTVVGDKTQIFDIPGTGVIFQTERIDESGTINMDPVPASSGTVSRLSVSMRAPGGGGADSDTDGGNAGYAYATFNFKGSSYTIYAYGGKGGQDGNSGGAGGEGGTVSIPAELLSDPDFVYSISDGEDGETGGTAGTETASTDGGGLDGIPGTGGDGASTAFTTTSNDTPVTYTSSGTWTSPNTVAGETGRTITISAAGGGGGGANSNANSYCSWPAIGKAGNGGALITGTLKVLPSTLTFTIGTGGGAGFNDADGLSTTAAESGQSSGGSGAANGGNGGRGARGNGATGGAGGGATGVYFNGANAIIGAAGGGGGGGSGGGWNGGVNHNPYDGCYAGASGGKNASTNVYSQTTAIDFDDGSTGGSSYCTAGGGGGGGGGAGPVGGGSGGDAGVAGAGHNGNGGGEGGRRGDSAYRSDYITASWSDAGNGGSPGNNGGNGYVTISVSRSILNYGKVGGAGGQGALVNFSLNGKDNVNISITAGLQTPGNGGGNGKNGLDGFINIAYTGSEGGGEAEGSTTVPTGVYYDGTSLGVPGGASKPGNIWTSSSNDSMIPVTPGLGTGSTSKFAIISGGGIPSYDGKVTKYLPFIGSGTREYVMGGFDLRNVEKIRFLMIRGNNTNGGATPEEDIILYWRQIGSSTTSLVDTVVTASTTTPGWDNYDVILPEESDIRKNNVELVLRQTRPNSQGDNSVSTQDNYGLAAITLFYGEVIENVFTPSDGSTITDVDEITTNIGVTKAGLASTDGFFEMSSSTPISTTVQVVPESNIPLITRYHRVKYLIKAI